jgi:homoserine dehydrogenase
MAAIRVGLMGFGRIGRNLFRILGYPFNAGQLEDGHRD